MERKTLLVDMDDTILDFKTEWFMTYDKEHGTDLIHEIKNWGIPERYNDAFEILQRPGFFRGLRPYPNMIDVLQRLSQVHDIVIVTSSVYGVSMKEKGEWFREYLHFLPRDNFIIAKRKELIRGDLLFDDGLHNLEKFPGITVGMHQGYGDSDFQPTHWVASALEFESLIYNIF